MTGVSEGVNVTVGVKAKVAEFICLGVPLRALLFASRPLRVMPSLLAHAVPPSAMTSFLSMLKYPGEADPAGQLPPSRFAVSITVPVSSFK
jgi:hypothetical protein